MSAPPSTLSAIADSELKRIIDAIGLPVFVVNVGAGGSFRYAALNARHEQATGIAHEDVCGRTPQEVFGAEEARQLRRNYQRCIERRREIEYDEALHFRAELSYWHTVLAPIFDHQGRIVRILGTATPTSEKRRDQQALRYQNLLLSAQQETTPDGILVVDEQGRARTWNRRHLEIWQVDETLMQCADPARRIARFAHRVKDPDTFLEQVLHLYQHLEVSEAGREVEMADGRILERYTRGLEDESGRYWGRIWFFRDITARKMMGDALRQSEERFRQIAQHLHHEIFWMASPDGQSILYVSPIYEEIWGQPCAHLYDAPLSWLDAVIDGDARRIRRLLRRPITRHVDAQFRIRRGDGEERWIHLRAFPIRNRSGRVYRIGGVAEDITARRLAEEQAKRHQADLAHIARVSMAGELASGLAHELNQPLAAVVSYAQAGARMARQGSDPEMLSQTLEKIARQGLRAGEMIHRLRRLVRKSGPEKHPLDLNQLIRNVTALAEVTAQRHDVEIRLLLAYRLPLVKADSIQIEQVLFNLIQNGIDATASRRDRPRRLLIRSAHPAPQSVEVSVADTGPGLASELIGDSLFEPFITTKPEGMGLGLSISRTIIEAHSGRMQAANLPEGGARVTFTLPVLNGD